MSRKRRVRYSPHLAGRPPDSIPLVVRGRAFFAARLYKGKTIARLSPDAGPWIIVGKLGKGNFRTLADAKASVSRSTDPARARRRKRAEPTSSSVHTVRGGLPSLGKRRR